MFWKLTYMAFGKHGQAISGQIVRSEFVHTTNQAVYLTLRIVSKLQWGAHINYVA